MIPLYPEVYYYSELCVLCDTHVYLCIVWQGALQHVALSQLRIFLSRGQLCCSLFASLNLNRVGAEGALLHIGPCAAAVIAVAASSVFIADISCNGIAVLCFVWNEPVTGGMFQRSYGVACTERACS